MYLFFAILNFTLSGAIFVIGILTLRKVSTPNEVVFASLPLLFALHQFTEGFVWLGVSHLIEPSALKLAEGIFIFYAQGLLPFLVPLAIWLLEPSGVRKKTYKFTYDRGGTYNCLYRMGSFYPSYLCECAKQLSCIRKLMDR